ncbi:MAG: hypothetical protein P8Y71_21925 [Pseudolabrys sp.]
MSAPISAGVGGRLALAASRIALRPAPAALPVSAKPSVGATPYISCSRRCVVTTVSAAGWPPPSNCAISAKLAATLSFKLAAKRARTRATWSAKSSAFDIARALSLGERLGGGHWHGEVKKFYWQTSIGTWKRGNMEV